MKKKVLLVQPIHPAAISRLQEEAEVVIAEKTDEEYVKSIIKDFHGVIVRVNPVSRELIEAAPQLQVIGRHGVGLDIIDVSAASDFCIPVVYAPGSNTNAVAEHAVSLMLALAKNLFPAHAALTQSNDYSYRHKMKTCEIKDKVIGIIGMGKIGCRIGTICQHGFGAKIVGFDPYITEESLKGFGLDVKLYKTVDELLEVSDFVSLHAPATPENNKLIGAPQFKLMKKSAYLINTARGPLVDEAALYEALVHGEIAGAGLDVFDPEPPQADNPLYKLPNIIVTPHMAAHSEEGLKAMGMMPVEQILQVFRGEKPIHLANPQIWESRRQ